MHRGPRNSGTPIAMTTLLPRSWLLNFLLREGIDSKAGAGNTPDEAGESCSARDKKVLKQNKAKQIDKQKKPSIMVCQRKIGPN